MHVCGAGGRVGAGNKLLELRIFPLLAVGCKHITLPKFLLDSASLLFLICKVEIIRAEISKGFLSMK